MKHEHYDEERKESDLELLPENRRILKKIKKKIIKFLYIYYLFICIS